MLRPIGYTLLTAVVLCVGVFIAAQPAAAQNGSLTLTVTPPLFQINLQPGETWTSGIQVVNGNPYDITVYAEPVLFTPEGEEGRPSFTMPPTVNGQPSAPDSSTLAGWITAPTGAITIAREQTAVLPIAITVPEDAAPGGHYAAILIGNRAPQGAREDGAVSVTSSIASLIFLRVAGTVVEDGRIRDFATEQLVYDTPEARLALRFENQGNVHLQPKGDITIYNMFGKKRGYIPINQGGDYGNVLPGSIRKFSYTWQAEPGNWDIGRYRAEATLGYGVEAKQFAQSTTYFYVLPLIPLAQVVGSVLALLVFFAWAIRAYVRRALALESARVVPHVGQLTPETGLSDPPSMQPDHVAAAHARPRLKFDTLIRPIQAGIVDLRSVGAAPARPETAHEPAVGREDTKEVRNAHTFFYTYRYFFLFIGVVAVGWLAASAFLEDVLTLERGYNAAEERSDGSTIPLSE